MQFLTAFFPLLRYEDEIRLCSGMEYTFTELKKVSGRRRLSSGRALHQLRVVTEEAGEAGWFWCSSAKSGLWPASLCCGCSALEGTARGVTALEEDSSVLATATISRGNDKCVWATCSSEKPVAPGGSTWGPGQPTPAPSRGWSAPVCRALCPSTLLGGRQHLSSRRHPRAGKGWRSITVFALVSRGWPHPG